MGLALKYFRVECEPVAQPRHRASSIGGRARMYLPAKHPVHHFKSEVKDAAIAAMDGDPVVDCPLRMECLFVMPRPKSKVWKTRAMPREPHVGKPDTDNLVKAVKDALEGIVYKNDSQVWDEHSVKVIAAGGEVPHVEIHFSCGVEICA